MSEADPVILVDALEVVFPGRSPSDPEVHAVRGVTFQVARSSTLALVGASGSGKTTIGRVLVGWSSASGGRVLLGGSDTRSLSRRQRAGWVQLVPQHPGASLDPLWTVGATIADACRLGQGQRLRRSVARERAELLMRRVGLDPSLGSRRPHQLSGGQLQRIAIARAMALKPKALVADEPTSALDPRVRAEVSSLLSSLCREESIALVLITHDFALVHELADRVVVLDQGAIVERGATEAVMARPQSEATRRLLAPLVSRRAAIGR